MILICDICKQETETTYDLVLFHCGLRYKLCKKCYCKALGKENCQMILIKGVDRLDIFLSTDEIKQLNEKMNDVEEHTGFDEVEGDYIKLTPDKNSKFELRRIN